VTRTAVVGFASAAWLAALVVAACQGRPAGSAPAGSTGSAVARDAAPLDANLDGCRAVAVEVAAMPPTARAQALLDACQPCGDWQPLLDWSRLQAEGGPTRAAIEQAMIGCGAFCDPNAKQRFLGTLDAARGQGTRLPWRLLGQICKAAVSALPDARFVGGPYFALDRIARAIGDPAVLAAIAVPLPAISITGVGIDLPPAASDAAPPSIVAAAGPAITVDAAQFLLGALPRAQLSPDGLLVTGDYPGTPIAPAALARALAAPAIGGEPVAVLAPRALPAARIAAVVTAAGGHPLRLAVGVSGPGHWNVPAQLAVVLVAPAAGARGSGIRIALTAADEIAITGSPAELQRGPVTVVIDDAATVANLAHLLAALAAQGATAVQFARPPPPATKRPSGKP